MEQLIINKRDELPKGKRALWDVLTILLWVWFIYLWNPIYHIFYRIATSGLSFSDEISEWIYDNIHSVTFFHAMEMLILTPIILFALARIHRYANIRGKLEYTPDEYASYFDISASRLKKSSESQYITIYHNEFGKIIKLEDEIK